MVANIITPNTRERVAEIIATAATIVVEAELYDDLQAIAFTEAVRLLGATIVVPAPPVTVPGGLSLAARLPPLAG